MRLLIFIISLFVSLTASASPAIRVSKTTSLVDEEIAIEIKRVKPFQHVILHAETIDAAGETWSSEAVYCADERGRIRLAKNAPIDGSYSGIDGMGLFWSMKPESGADQHFKLPEEMTVTLSLIIDRAPVAGVALKRLKKNPEVRRFSIREKGIVGALFLPPSKKPLPVIVTLSGLQGGLSESKAQLLASHGFAVLALGYFGLDGLPADLENIPLEYFDTALRWVNAQPDLDGKRIGLFGFSRGAELALLLGSHFPDAMHAIVATSPSSLVFGAFDKKEVPAWTYQGKPLPLIPTPDRSKSGATDAGHPFHATPLVLKTLESSANRDAAAIPIEKIKCPLLIISGGDDQLWPAALFAKQIEERLKNTHSKIQFKHINYPKAGHQIGIPFLPSNPLYFHSVTNLWFSLGGSAEDDERASRDSWRKVIVFFQNKLSVK